MQMYLYIKICTVKLSHSVENNQMTTKNHPGFTAAQEGSRVV